MVVRQMDFRDLEFPGSDVRCVAFLDNSTSVSITAKPFAVPPASQHGAFHIDSTVLKGFGMFANRDIAPGTVFLVEHPILVVPVTEPSDLYEEAVSRLRPHERELFWSLSSCFHPSARNKDENIIGTNAFGITLPGTWRVIDPEPDATHRALFPQSSRINHSCSPNATLRFDLESFTLCLKASKLITAESEITLSYVSELSPYVSRRADLRALFRFDCACESCFEVADNAHAIEESDKRRLEIYNLTRVSPEPILLLWSTDLSMPRDAMIVPSMRLLDLMQWEGLRYPTWCSICALVIAASYAAMSNVEMFLVWGRKARDVLCENGASTQKLDSISLWLADPETHPLWGCRDVAP